MKHEHPRTVRRSGFTLLELLAVMVIIGILAGILVPVVVRTKDRAQELSAKDLCVQIAAAWNTLAVDEGRLPSAALLKSWCSEETGNSEGDLVLPMDAGVSSVLNWWKAEALVPAGDVAKFKPATISGKTVLKPGDMANPDLKAVEFWPHDQYLDRSFVQRCFGFYPPWVERRFKTRVDALLSSSEQSDLTEDEDIETLKKESGAWRVRVILDTNGDGILVFPEEIGVLPGVPVDEEDQKGKLRGTAAVWTLSKDGKRILSSW